MKNTINIQSVDAYIASFPPAVQKKLKEIRKIIRSAAPKAEELISYQMPSYKYEGVLVYFAAYENHLGFYAMPGAVLAFKKKLAASSIEGTKGTIRFPLNEKLPAALIRRIVEFRVKENEKKSIAKKTARKNKTNNKPLIK